MVNVWDLCLRLVRVVDEDLFWVDMCFFADYFDTKNDQAKNVDNIPLT